MKVQTSLPLVCTLLALALPAQAQFSLDGLKKQANDAANAQLNTGGIDFAAVSQQLTTAFNNASPELKKQVGDLLSSFSKGKDSKSTKYLDMLRQAKLTPEQAKVFDAARNDLIAAIVNRNFKFEDSSVQKLVADASSAFAADKSGTGLSKLSEIAGAAKLTDGQKQLLVDLQAAAGPLMGLGQAPAAPASAQ